MNTTSSLFEETQEATAYIRQHSDLEVAVGLILGTGLSGLADDIAQAVTIDYKDIPHFPHSTVESHRGQLILGYLSGVPVVAMAGRFHYYEGYSMQEVTFPVRVLQALGIEYLFISNAAGSTNSSINAGDLVFVRDHINLQPANPLRGPNDERLGPRFPDMLNTYDRELNQMALRIATKNGVRAWEGVYVALPGPNLETPSEYRYLNIIGGDLVGMSTVPEVIVARHMHLQILVVSVISNKCYPLDEIKETSVADVIRVVEKSAPGLQLVIKKLLQELYA